MDVHRHSSRATRALSAVLLLSLSAGFFCCHGRRHRTDQLLSDPQQYYDDLELRTPEEEIAFEAGFIRIWRKDVKAFADRRMDVSEIAFFPDGLMVPQYADADGIAYVLEGTGKVGVVFPSQGLSRELHVRRVQPGDVVAIPKGLVFWWYNDGYGNHRIFCASDTSNGVRPGLYHQFSIAGAKVERFGGLLHGFRRESLASSWGVDEEIVRILLDSQNGTSIVKSQGRIVIPAPKRQRRIEFTPNSMYTPDVGEENLGFAEFTYNVDEGYPDLYVKRGGWKKTLSERNLPILNSVGMSAIRIGLEPNALEAPCFYSNANQIMYITSGSGRIEVSSSNGESLLVTELQEGSIIAIPKYLPSIRVAGGDGMSFICFLTAARALPSYLEGRDSVYDGIPEQVLAASFNADEETLTGLRGYRRSDEVIFPPSQQAATS